MDTNSLTIILALIGAVLVAFAALFTLPREIKRVENLAELSKREIADMRREMTASLDGIKKDLGEVIISYGREAKHTQEEVNRSQKTVEEIKDRLDRLTVAIRTLDAVRVREFFRDDRWKNGDA